MKKRIKNYVIVLLGVLIVAITYDLFLSPYQIVAGGVGGLAIIVRKLIGMEESTFIFLANIVLVIISYIFLGKEKTKNTVMGALLLPIFIKLFSNISSFLTFEIDPMVVAILGGALSGFGYGLVFGQNFTTGGTDILNQLAEKYFKIPMAKSILYIDGFIVLCSFLVFGFTSMMYALIALFLISTISNQTQLGINRNRVFYITSKKLKEIKEFLTENSYDVTIVDSVGGYSKKKAKLLICGVHSKDYYRIKEGIEIIDPNAFIVVANAYEELNANVKIRKSALHKKTS